MHCTLRASTHLMLPTRQQHRSNDRWKCQRAQDLSALLQGGRCHHRLRRHSEGKYTAATSPQVCQELYSHSECFIPVQHALYQHCCANHARECWNRIGWRGKHDSPCLMKAAAACQYYLVLQAGLSFWGHCILSACQLSARTGQDGRAGSPGRF